VIRCLAVFNTKLKQGVEGRKNTFEKLNNAVNPKDKTFWFHCASLGEYEQGLPVFKTLKHKYPNYKIVLSFFSPSGYDVRKHTKIADVVVYLPLDSKRNARRFLDIVNPDYIIFVKYEIWPNFLFEIKSRNLKAILISAVFRKNQSFFSWYGGFMRSSLFAFNHIFTQDENSKTLLERINYKTTTVSGDTRFDRVFNQLHVDNSVSFIENFKNEKFCIVFGSTWPEDDKLYMDYINKNSHRDLKFIIAPHNIKPSYIASIASQLTVESICFSKINADDLSKFNVFILDTIGYLSKVYSYADIAYVGGAAGSSGLHNILEPAVFGIPIVIGKNYDKFPEAIMLIELGGVTSVSTSQGFEAILTALISDVSLNESQGLTNKTFIEKNRGAVIQIIEYIRI